MKSQFQKFLSVISAFVILLSMAVPAFATQTDDSIDYDKAIVGTWYFDLDGELVDDYVFPDSLITWTGTMEAISTGLPSILRVYKSPDPLSSGSQGCLFDFFNNWDLSIGSATVGIAQGSSGPLYYGNISCSVSKIKIVAPDPVSYNNEKLYNWFKANGFVFAPIPNLGGSSGDPATEQVARIDYSFWQLNDTISVPDPLTSFSASFSLPYVDPDVAYSSFSITSSTLKYSSLFAYSFSNDTWVNDKYRYVYFGAQTSSNVALLRWLKDNGRLVVQSEMSQKPTSLDDLYGLTFTFNSSLTHTGKQFSVSISHATNVYPNGYSSRDITYSWTQYQGKTYFSLKGGGSGGYLYLTDSGWQASWIRFTQHGTNADLVEFLLQNATLTGWPTDPPKIPAYVPPDKGGVLGPPGGNTSDTPGWITGGGLINTQPIPGLNAGFLSWLSSTLDGIFSVNLFGFFSLADILSFCMSVCIIMILLKFFGG